MDWTDIERFLSGEMNAEDAAAFRARIARDAELRTAFEHASRIWEHPATSLEGYDVDEAREAVQAKLRERSLDASQRAKAVNVFRAPPSRGARWANMSAVVAIAAALIVGVGVTWYERGPVRTHSVEPAPVAIATSRGEVAASTLKDGTQITVGPASSLRYAVDTARCGDRGDACPRVFDVEGEVAFDVVHHTNAPFIVRTAGVTVRVLGTRFAVRKYADDAAVSVTVANGKVSVGDRRVLTGGTVARVARDGSMSIDTTSNTDALLDWTHGTLTFPSYTPLSEALPQLARWYNLQFVLSEPSLRSRRLVGRFPSTTLTPATLDALAATLGVRYARVGNTITLYPLTPEVQ